MTPTEKRCAHKRARRAWVRAYGPIPADHHIHHKDKNVLNNALENLECIPAFEHLSQHGKEPTAARSAHRARHLPTLLEAGRKAMRTPERRRLSRLVMARVQANATPTTLTCKRCGQPCEGSSLTPHKAYCSNACRAAARRDSRVDNVERDCIECGAQFSINRYQPTRTCSARCAGKIGARKRLGRTHVQASASSREG